LKIDPHNQEVYKILADVYTEQKEYEEAKETLEYLLKLTHNNKAAVFSSLANLAKERGNLKEAEEEYLKSISLSADNYLYFISLAEVYLELEEYKYALETAQRALILANNNPKILDFLINVSIIIQDKELAVKYLDRLKEVNIDNKKIGYFNEKLIRCQDYEFNCRIRKTNGLVWINPNAIAKYKNKKSLFSFYKKQTLLEAPYNAYMWYIAPYTFTYRHAITGIFSTGVIGGIVLATFYPIIRIIFLSVMILYFLLALFSAVQQAIRYKKPLHILTLPICFFLYHFSHGLGIFSGLVRLAIGTAPVQKH